MNSTSDLAWFKSSYSSGSEGDCVEVATSPTTIHVRDSKTPSEPHLTLSPKTWQTFVTFATEE
ncbi:MAG: DUF397 domain-containing protein [Streptomyces sp.]|nr:DUF397 domain-containing protein [Streptomyces sp.]NUS28351.1 DUF397 domain-containing protein [Streptomyces sp.]NUS76108.1 DUF397 domain-containing protein [Streptomyces sp.]